MNKNAYRLVFSKNAGMLVAVAEVVTSQGKSTGESSTPPVGAQLSCDTAALSLKGLSFAIASAALVASGAYVNPVWAQTCGVLPTGGQVTYGSGSISSTGTKTTVNQGSSVLGVNWNSFSIGAGCTVQFVQPSSSSVAVNRVTGTNRSEIYGSLQANGQVFLLNPNGVLFAAGSEVNVGALLTSTRNLTDAQLAAGNFTLTGDSNQDIVNQGNLTATGGANGYVVLHADRVTNEGKIVANAGKIVIAAGQKLALSLTNGQLVSADVDGDVVNALVANKGLIVADGGKVLLTARGRDAVLSTVMINSGVIRARTLGDITGSVSLTGGSGDVISNGSIDVAGLQSGQKGGDVVITGNRIGLFDNARIDARGAAGGGTVLVGGDFQGGNATAVPHASMVMLSSGALIDASATQQGAGGKVVLWSDDYTGFAGKINAMGAGSGAGGLVETSSKNILTVTGGVDARGGVQGGSAGTWLLDPTNINIVVGNTTAGQTNTTGATTFNGTTNSADVSNDSINTALNAGTNVTVSTASAAGANGNIIQQVGADIVYSGSGTVGLTLLANQSITINASILSTGSGRLNVNLAAALGNSSASGSVTLENATIATNGGNLSVTANRIATGAASHAVIITNSTIDVGGGVGAIVGTSSGGSGVYIFNNTTLNQSSSFLSTGTGQIVFTGVSNYTASTSNVGVSPAYTGVSALQIRDGNVSASGNISFIGRHISTASGQLYNNASITFPAIVNVSAAVTTPGNMSIDTASDNFGVEMNGVALSLSGTSKISGTSATATGVQISGKTSITTSNTSSLRIEGVSTAILPMQQANTAKQNSTTGVVTYSVSNLAGAAGVVLGATGPINLAGNVSITGNSTAGTGVSVSALDVSISGKTIIVGASTATGINSAAHGVLVSNALNLSVSGDLTLNGSAANSNFGFGHGLYFLSPNATITGNLSLIGSAGIGHGVFLNANSRLQTMQNANLYVAGSASLGSGSNGRGVLLSSDGMVLGGNSTINGFSTKGVGVMFAGSAASTGNLTVVGTGAGTGAGVYFNGDSFDTANGTSTSVTGSSNNGSGVVHAAGDLLLGGNTLITGSSGGLGKAGVEINTTGTITATGSGVTMIGRSNSSVGILLANGTLTTNATGVLNLQGTSTSTSFEGVRFASFNNFVTGGNTTITGKASGTSGVKFLSGNQTLGGDTLINATSTLANVAAIEINTTGTINLIGAGVRISGSTTQGRGVGLLAGNINTTAAGAQILGQATSGNGVEFSNGTLTTWGETNISGTSDNTRSGVLFSSGNQSLNGNTQVTGLSTSSASVAGLSINTTGVVKTNGTGVVLRGDNARTDAFSTRGLEIVAGTVTLLGNTTLIGNAVNGTGLIMTGGTLDSTLGTNTRIIGSSNNGVGLSLQAAPVVSLGGNATLSGQSQSDMGLTLVGATVAVVNGNVTISGSSNVGAAGLSAQTGSVITTSGSSKLTVLGSLGDNNVTGGSGVSFTGGSRISGNSTGDMLVTGISGATGTGNAYGIYFASGSELVASGNLNVSGQSNGNSGVLFSGANVSVSGVGQTLITGSSLGVIGAASGVEFSSGARFVSTSAGNTAITGSVGGTSTSAAGVQLSSNSSLSTSGNLSIFGQSNIGSGVYVGQDSNVTNSLSTAWIKVTGHTLHADANGTSSGVTLVSRGNVSAAGVLEITGSSAGDSAGVLISTNSSASAAGNLSISGTSQSRYAINVISGSLIQQLGNGSVHVQGLSLGNSSTTAGVRLLDSSITNAGSGDVLITGTTSDSASSGNAVYLQTNAAILSTGSGNVSLNGQTAGNGSAVLINASVINATGAITLVGSSAGLGDGVEFSSNSSVAGGNAISIAGTSALGAGIRMTTGIVLLQQSNANTTLRGQATQTGASHGISISTDSSLISNGTGAVSLDGSSNSTQSNVYGVLLSTRSSIQLGGVLNITGTSGSDNGVYVFGSNITKLGNAYTTISGVSFGANSSTAGYGVYLASNSRLESNGSGTVTISGSASGNNTAAIGVSLGINSNILTGGNLSVTGSAAGGEGIRVITNSSIVNTNASAMTFLNGSTSSTTGGAVAGVTVGTGSTLNTAGSLRIAGFTGNANSNGNGFAMNALNSSLSVRGNLSITGTAAGTGSGVSISANNTISTNGSLNIAGSSNRGNGVSLGFGGDAVGTQNVYNNITKVWTNTTTSLNASGVALDTQTVTVNTTSGIASINITSATLVTALIRSSQGGEINISGTSAQSYGLALRQLDVNATGNVSMSGLTQGNASGVMLGYNEVVVTSSIASNRTTNAMTSTTNSTLTGLTVLRNLGSGTMNVTGTATGASGAGLYVMTGNVSLQTMGAGDLNLRGVAANGVGVLLGGIDAVRTTNTFTENKNTAQNSNTTTNTTGTFLAATNLIAAGAGSGKLSLDGSSGAGIGVHVASANVSGFSNVTGTSASGTGLQVGGAANANAFSGINMTTSSATNPLRTDNSTTTFTTSSATVLRNTLNVLGLVGSAATGVGVGLVSGNNSIFTDLVGNTQNGPSGISITGGNTSMVGNRSITGFSVSGTKAIAMSGGTISAAAGTTLTLQGGPASNNAANGIDLTAGLINVSGGAVILNNTGPLISQSGASTLVANDVLFVGQGNTATGNITANNLTINRVGNVTQSSGTALNVAVATNITASSVMLNSTGNNFGSTALAIHVTGNVTLWGIDINLGNVTAGNLTAAAVGNVTLINSSLLSSGGAMSVNLTAAATGSGKGFVNITNGNISTQGGRLVISGNTASANGLAAVRISNSTLSANGTGSVIGGVAATREGVQIDGGNTLIDLGSGTISGISTTGMAVSINGTSSDSISIISNVSGRTVGGTNRGVYLNGANISIKGQVTGQSFGGVGVFSNATTLYVAGNVSGSSGGIASGVQFFDGNNTIDGSVMGQSGGTGVSFSNGRNAVNGSLTGTGSSSDGVRFANGTNAVNGSVIGVSTDGSGITVLAGTANISGTVDGRSENSSGVFLNGGRFNSQGDVFGVSNIAAGIVVAGGTHSLQANASGSSKASSGFSLVDGNVTMLASHATIVATTQTSGNALVMIGNASLKSLGDLALIAGGNATNTQNSVWLNGGGIDTTGHNLTITNYGPGITQSGAHSIQAGNVNLLGQGNTTVGNISANNLTINRAGNVTQSIGTNLTIGVGTNLTAGHINLNNSGNRFGSEAVTANATGNLTLASMVDLLLGNVTAANSAIRAQGNISQGVGSKLNIAGLSNFVGGGAGTSLNLTNANNILGGVLSASNFTNVAVNASGNLSADGIVATNIALAASTALFTGNLAASNNVSLVGGDVINSGNISAGNSAALTGNNITNTATGVVCGNVSTTATGTHINNAGSFGCTGSVTTVNASGTFNNSGALLGDPLTILSANIVNSGNITNTGVLNITAVNITNLAPGNITGAIATNLVATGTLFNNGTVGASGNTSVGNGTVLNNAGGVIGNAGGSTTVSGTAITNNGTIAGANTSVTGTNVTSTGSISATNNATLTGGNVVNSGSVTAGNAANVTGNNITNTATGNITGNQRTTLTATGTLTNNGTIGSSGTTTLTALAIDNAASGSIGNKQANTSLNATAGNLTNTGMISGGNVSLAASGRIWMQGPANTTIMGTVMAMNDLNATAGTDLRLGNVMAGGNLRAVAITGDLQQVTGSNVSVGGSSNLTAGGDIVAIQSNNTWGAVDATAGADKRIALWGKNLQVNNASAGRLNLIANTGDLQILGSVVAYGQGVNTSGSIGNIVLRADAGNISTSGNIFTVGGADGSVFISANGTVSNSGNISAINNISVGNGNTTITTDFFNSGKVKAANNVMLKVTNNATNSATGEVCGNVSTSVQAVNVNNAGQMGCAGSNTSVNVSNSMLNNGTIAGAPVNVMGGDVVNNGNITGGETTVSGANITNSGTITGSGTTNVSGTGDVTNNGSVGGTTVTVTGGNVTNTAPGNITGTSSTSVTTSGTLSNNGTIGASGNTSVGNGTVLNNAGGVIGNAGGSTNVSGTAITNNGTIAGASVNVMGGDVVNNGDISGGHTTVSGANITNSGTITGEMVNVSGANVTNAGNITGGDTVVIQATSTVNNSGKIVADDVMVNASLVTNSGNIEGMTVKVDAQNLINAGTGNITGSDQTTVVATTSVTNNGTIGASGDTSVGNGTVLNNAGGVIGNAGGSTTVSGTAITNNGTIAGAPVNVMGGDVVNNGNITGGQTTVSGANITNSGSMDGTGITNVTGGQINNTGVIGGNTVEVTSQGNLSNTGSGNITGRHGTNVTATGSVNNNATMGVSGDTVLKAASIVNNKPGVIGDCNATLTLTGTASGDGTFCPTLTTPLGNTGNPFVDKVAGNSTVLAHQIEAVLLTVFGPYPAPTVLGAKDLRSSEGNGIGVNRAQNTKAMGLTTPAGIVDADQTSFLPITPTEDGKAALSGNCQDNQIKRPDGVNDIGCN